MTEFPETNPAAADTETGSSGGTSVDGGETAALFQKEAPSLGRLHDSTPHSRVLSNGRYYTIVTGNGTGFSQCGEIAVTRWSGDRVAGCDGVLAYLRDVDSGEVWSIGASPVGEIGGTFYARCGAGTVTLGRRHEGIEATCEVAVASDADAEVRFFVLRNRASTLRRIELTVYAEIVAGHRGADLAHPAFAKLFVQTSFDSETSVVTARRRPRSSEETPVWAAATLAGEGDLEIETDRAAFLGRGRSYQRPAALSSRDRLGGTTGSVLDPVFALRRTVELAPGREVPLVFVLAAGAGASGDTLAATVTSLRDRVLATGAKDIVRASAAAERARRKRLQISNEQADLAQELAGAMVYALPALAAPAADREQADFADNPLGALGTPHDALLAVLPLRHDEGARAAAVVSMAGYLASLGMKVSVVLLCEEDGCSSASCIHRSIPHDSGAHVAVAVRAELGPVKTATLRAQAHWLVDQSLPELADAGEETVRGRSLRARIVKPEEPSPSRDKLLSDNGYGGFSKDGREYVMRVGPAAFTDPKGGAVPPMPWANIVANERFGFLVTETGAGYTWGGNSRQHKITPWSNDPVLDPHGEALYLRDNANGRYWSPLPGPAPSGAWSEARHGMGWSRWVQRSEALEQTVTTFVAGEDPVRITCVRVSNRGSRERSLSLYSFARLVLGVEPVEASRFVITSESSGILLARNPRSEDHTSEFAFAAVLSGPGQVSWTTDRQAFVGRGGTMQAPRAVAAGGSLDGTIGGDPCFAFEVPIVLPARGETEVVFALGHAVDTDQAAALVTKLREDGAASAALEESRATWRDLTSALEVRTPSPTVDLMLNGWLLYQSLSCRMYARSAYYQSGGALGFRDQLQDSSSLVYARPDLFRSQILLHAAHQFEEGDVLHWWHPPKARGTRTRFSDDLVWLPYLTATYIGTTGDESVLEEKTTSVKARQLAPGEDETYLLPERTTDAVSVYEHCCRALDRSLTTGAHGLPLMGTGDWNDGMNRVGREGRGESVWLAFFLVTTLDLFVPIVEKRSDWERLRQYRQYRETLAAGIEKSGWDGQWYRRAYYDDGEVRGSASSEECRIDAIAQAWAVMSGIATPERAKSAIEAVGEHLVDEEAGIIRLLWPPFDKTSHDPGYIKGYVPGIRENGGQYSHAAIWVIRALAKMGDRKRAVPWFEMISPIAHARDRANADRYKVEPYVIAADIYGTDPHRGRGGWTWYTGSAGWMYRTGIESLLGLTIEDGRLLRIKPCVPDSWPGFRIKYRLPDRRTAYDIEVENPSGNSSSVVSAMIGTQALPIDRGGARIVFRRDGKLHKVKIVLG